MHNAGRGCSVVSRQEDDNQDGNDQGLLFTSKSDGLKGTMEMGTSSPNKVVVQRELTIGQSPVEYLDIIATKSVSSLPRVSLSS